MDQNSTNLQTVVDRASAGVASESLDISVSEIINLHKTGDISIAPTFQRLFRWEDEQQSRLVESLILGLPIPQLFLFQREDGVLELVDGLQRVSSIIRFVDSEALQLTGKEEHRKPLVLTGCDLVRELNEMSFEQLPPSVRRDFLRKSVRAIIIRRTNQPTLRYEMFKRLNSGGSPAEYQEIRNAQIRVLGETGERFLDFLDECSQHNSFVRTTETMSDSVLEKQGRQELVLRFFAGVHRRELFRGNVAEWIDNMTEAILIRRTLIFQYDEQKQLFIRVFDLIDEKLGQFAFVKYRGGNPIGGLAPAYFEAVCLAVADNPMHLESMSASDASAALAMTVESQGFREVTGPGANSLPKLIKRIELIAGAFNNGKDI